MKKRSLYCIIGIVISMLIVSCAPQNVHDNKETVPEAMQKETIESVKPEDSNTDMATVIELSPEEQFDNVFAYFSENGSAGKKRHSWTSDASYVLGANVKDRLIQFMYISDDQTQGVLLTLDRDGNFNVLVNIKSKNEGVIGTAEMNAAEYTFGYEFSDFTYQTKQRDWDYEKFKLRANAYIRDTMLYSDSLLQDYLDIDLNNLGFSSWQNPGTYKDGMITSKDVAGMWNYKSLDKSTYSSKLFLTENKIYWRGYEDAYADAITSSAMTESEDYLISQDMVMSMTDPYTGEVVIKDNYVNNGKKTDEQFRRYIYHGEDGNLYMRVESVYQGLSNQEDGKIYVKEDNDGSVALTPQIYYPSEPEDETDSQNDVNEDVSTSFAGSGTYQSILDEYTEKMEKRVPELVQEYKAQSTGISDINRLAEICNNKISELAEICIEGTSQMAKLMYSNGDTYDTYEKWASKLMDNYADIANEIQDAYLDSATAW